VRVTQVSAVPPFRPITILLETAEEVEALKLVLNVYPCIPDAVEKCTSSYCITERRKDLIRRTLRHLWIGPIETFFISRDDKGLNDAPNV